MQDYDKFKDLLDEKYNFPCPYSFKFVVPSAQRSEIEQLFVGDHMSEKRSKNGKYTSFTITKTVESSSEIIAAYRKCENIENLIML